jgi:hypothetical protein
MPNKHFCQGPTCHEKPTQSRFLKSRGVLRGRYAYATLDRTPDENQYGWTPPESDKYFCSQGCKNEWLNKNMACVEGRTVVPFINHRRESQGYAKVPNEESHWGPSYEIQKV